MFQFSYILFFALTKCLLQLPPAYARPAAGTEAYDYQDGEGDGTSPLPPPTTGNSSGTVSGKISLPAACSKVNGIGVGWLPGEGTSLTAITSQLGSTPSCWDGQYAQITQTGEYTDSNRQLLGKLDDIQNPAATIFVASIMPTIAFTSVDATVAGGIAKVLKQFTDKGIEVWLRYAHEMNYYTLPNSEGGHYDGDSTGFKQSWATVSAAVKPNPKIKMFWSPNGQPDDWDKWYPDSGQVDVAGIDVYPKNKESFSTSYQKFCEKYSSLPFVIGETGAPPDYKQSWLQQLSSADAKKSCPNYVGFSWFEYNKEADFRIASGGQSIAKNVLGLRRRTTRHKYI